MKKLNKNIFKKDLINKTVQLNTIGGLPTNWTQMGNNNAGRWNCTLDWQTDDKGIGGKRIYICEMLDSWTPYQAGYTAYIGTLNTTITIAGPNLPNKEEEPGTLY